MKASINKFFESVGNFFAGGDQIPCVARESLKIMAFNHTKKDCLLRLSWALVHSKHPKDVQRGIAMLEASLKLKIANTPLHKREIPYQLAVGYYRSGDYSRSRQLVEQCLERAPNLRQALYLKKTVEDKIAKDGMIRIGITATAVGLIAGGLAVGYYGSGDYSRNRQLVERCLKRALRQALYLKKTVDDKIAKDGVIRIGITATAVGFIAGGLAAALARKK
ncbi:hypothetical protein QQ045_028413 [Rhodiola kirilowii]